MVFVLWSQLNAYTMHICNTFYTRCAYLFVTTLPHTPPVKHTIFGVSRKLYVAHRIHMPRPHLHQWLRCASTTIKYLNCMFVWRYFFFLLIFIVQRILLYFLLFQFDDLKMCNTDRCNTCQYFYASHFMHVCICGMIGIYILLCACASFKNPLKSCNIGWSKVHKICNIDICR